MPEEKLPNQFIFNVKKEGENAPANNTNEAATSSNIAETQNPKKEGEKDKENGVQMPFSEIIRTAMFMFLTGLLFSIGGPIGIILGLIALGLALEKPLGLGKLVEKRIEHAGKLIKRLKGLIEHAGKLIIKEIGKKIKKQAKVQTSDKQVGVGNGNKSCQLKLLTVPGVAFTTIGRSRNTNETRSVRSESKNSTKANKV